MQMKTARFFCTISTAFIIYSKYYSFVYFYHDHYFIKLSKYVAKLIGMLLPVIWALFFTKVA